MKKGIISIVFIIIICFAVYALTGLYVIQPLGAIPEGATVWYWRVGLNLPFVSSADGFLIKQNQGVSLFSRMVVMTKHLEEINKRRIINLPYQKTLYLLSTGGIELEK